MIKKLESPAIIKAAGTRPKKIEEFIGMANSGTASVSIARMKSPEGWEEPGQRPEFDEYTVVLEGRLKVAGKGSETDVSAGEAVIVTSGEWVRYSTPYPGGAEYIAVCLPAFTPATVHRDQD